MPEQDLEAAVEAEEVTAPACSPAPLLPGDAPPVAEGVAYLRALNRYELPLVDALQRAIASGNMSAARAAYVRMRPLYEQVGRQATALRRGYSAR
jgi:hypothetical protein